MNKRNLLRAALALPLVLPLVHPAAAAAEAQPRVIRYGGDAAFAPFESLDGPGRPLGFQMDLLAELGPLLGVEFQVKLRPWAQTEAAFRAGQLDLVAMVDTTQRRTWALFTHGHATPALAVYHRRGLPEPQGLKDLADRRLALIDGEAMRDTVANALAGLPAPALWAKDPGQVLAALQDDRADVALLPRAYADPLLAAGQAPDVVASRLSLGLQTYALAVAPGQDALRAELQKGLDTLERNGRLEVLRTRWLSSHRDLAVREQLQNGLTQQRTWTWALGGASVAGLAWMGLGLRRRGQRIAAEKQHRAEAESALRRAEELLERSFGHNPEPMLIVERDSGVVRDANAALLSLLGVRPEGLIGQALPALDRHVDSEALAQLIASLDSAGTLDAVPLRLARADGQARDCLVSAERFHIDAMTQVFCLVRDVTEQLQRDAALRKAYDALAAQLDASRHDLASAREGQARAEGRLQEFTRTVAHDLKAPVHAVQGFAGLLRSRLLAGHVDDALTISDHIGRAAERMNTMIAALSRLAQVGQQPLYRTSVDMGRLARDTWTLIAATHGARDVAFKLADLPTAQADPDLVAQVWQNLLHNASKYSARVAQAHVAVDSFRDERGTWYRVTDNGAGFDMAKASLLFQPFQRMHAGKDFEGSGVGLSLVRRIIEHHGGEIRLRSAPGVGTVAEFTLDAQNVPG